jgi:hypothetical protein
LQPKQALGSVLYEQLEQVESHIPERTDHVEIENAPPEPAIEIEILVLLLSCIEKAIANL